MILTRQFSPVLFLCLWAVSVSVCCAQDAPEGNESAPAALPEWVVLVLKPISANRVRPVTGVVVSHDGLVLVPQEFAAPGDQIIVLDGGTDIIANGRAATVKAQTAGLSVISAPGLQRQPAHFSNQFLQPDQMIHLAAFPPAELISQGEAPLWLAVTVKSSGNEGQDEGLEPPGVFADVSVLPNVSGPLIDDCGNFVGFSSADGVQSMDVSQSPVYLWKAELGELLSLVSVSLLESSCSPSDTSPVVTEVAEQVPDPEGTTDNALDVNNPMGVDAGEPEVKGDGSSEPEPAGINGLIALSLLLFVVVAGLTRFAFKRWANFSGQNRDLHAGTLLTGGNSGRPTAKPDKPIEPSLAGSFIEINGRMANGSPFLSVCQVNDAAIDVIIGRSGEADISIDSDFIHHKHARLSGSAGGLTITDLGSPGGTWINRVPCLPGEVMFIEPEDTLFLGDVSLQIAVIIAPVGITQAAGDS